MIILDPVQIKPGGPDPVPAPHVNPELSQQPSGASQRSLENEVHRPSDENEVPETSEEISEEISEEMTETFEEMSELTNSAIKQAASSASTGDYSTAIDVLVEAISWIKKSQAISDERCKILISSMQSMLHGIQIKNSCVIRGNL